MNPISAYQHNPLPSTTPIQSSSAKTSAQVLATASSTSATSTEDIISELRSMGVTVTVRSVPNNPEAIGRNAKSVGSFGSVTIAPNILEDMANDAGVRLKYLNKVSQWMNIKADERNWTVGGRRVTSMSMVIHECGTTHFVMMGEGCPPAEKEESEEVFRYTRFGVLTIVYSCGKVRRVSVSDDYPQMPVGNNPLEPSVSQDSNISVGNADVAIQAYSRNLWADLDG